MADHFMPAAEVDEVRQQWGGSVYEGAILRLCDSHEALREANTALQQQLAAMTAVARRYRDGFIPSPTYWLPYDTTTYAGADDAPKVSPAERAALAAMESDDG